MHNTTAHNFHNFIHLLKGDINKLTITHTLKIFSISLISIFFPIFLYTKGFSVLEIIISLLLHFFFGKISVYFALKLGGKFGVKNNFLIGYVFIILYYLTLYNADLVLSESRYLFLLIAFLFLTIGESFYWMGFHINFTLNFTQKKEGKQLGIISSLPIIFMIFAPLFGGFIILNFSFKILFLIVIFLLFISFFPVFFLKNKKIKHNLVIKEAIKGQDKQLNAIYIMEGFHHIALSVFWPLFLFFSAISFTFIGGFYFFSNTLAAISSYYGGKFSDNKNKNHTFKISAIFHGFSILIRPFFESLIFLASIQSLGGLTGPFFINTFHSIYYKVARKNPLNLIANREFYLSLGRILNLSLSSILILLLPVKIAILIIIVFAGIFIITVSFFVKNLDKY